LLLKKQRKRKRAIKGGEERKGTFYCAIKEREPKGRIPQRKKINAEEGQKTHHLGERVRTLSRKKREENVARKRIVCGKGKGSGDD